MYVKYIAKQAYWSHINNPWIRVVFRLVCAGRRRRRMLRDDRSHNRGRFAVRPHRRLYTTQFYVYFQPQNNNNQHKSIWRKLLPDSKRQWPTHASSDARCWWTKHHRQHSGSLVLYRPQWSCVSIRKCRPALLRGLLILINNGFGQRHSQHTAGECHGTPLEFENDDIKWILW